MTNDELNDIIAQGESIHVELKEAEQAMPSTLFETVCAFLNKEGGTIVLGVDDQRNIRGIYPHRVDQMTKDIITSSNNPEVLDPPFTLSPQQFDTESGQVLVMKIPVSSQVHRCRTVVYDRENDSDLKISDDTRLAEMYFRKRQTYTETHIYPALRLEDFNPEAIRKARTLIKARKPDHPWLELDDPTLLRRANLFRRDFQTREEGYTLAAALVFGTDEVIQSILPAYKLDAVVRISDLDRFDDRITLRTNLIDTYDQLMAFVANHLPDKFYLEGDQRRDLRTIIFREIVANIIVHREYMNASPTQWIIYKDRVEATNPNKVHFRGPLTLENFSPFPKNPIIAKLFVELGRVDELGSGLRNVNKYLPQYSGGAKPVFLEDDFFTTTIPLVVHIFSDRAASVLAFIGVKASQLSPEAIQHLKTISVKSEIAQEAEISGFLYHLVSSWIENGTKLPSLEMLNLKELRTFEKLSVSSSPPDGTKLAAILQSFQEKGANGIGKRFAFLFKLIVGTMTPQTFDDLLKFMRYKNKAMFRDRYLQLLVQEGLVQRTIPEKPTSPEQRYVLTDKGKLYLGGFPV
jgi:ATP-dependent DNA helicase RecG